MINVLSEGSTSGREFKVAKTRRKKQGVKILWRTAAEVLEERLPTGTPLDELIGGGIEKGEVVKFSKSWGCEHGENWKNFQVFRRVADGDA